MGCTPPVWRQAGRGPGGAETRGTLSVAFPSSSFYSSLAERPQAPISKSSSVITFCVALTLLSLTEPKAICNRVFAWVAVSPAGRPLCEVEDLVWSPQRSTEAAGKKQLRGAQAVMVLPPGFLFGSLGPLGITLNWGVFREAGGGAGQF